MPGVLIRGELEIFGVLYIYVLCFIIFYVIFMFIISLIYELFYCFCSYLVDPGRS